MTYRLKSERLNYKYIYTTSQMNDPLNINLTFEVIMNMRMIVIKFKVDHLKIVTK